jgi:hypothetical protein
MVSFNPQSLLMHILQLHIYTAWLSFYSFPNSPCSPCYPPLLPFILPLTYLAPSSCDRNRPPSYQVACRLTLFTPPFTQLSHPSQIPRAPIAQRLTTTTLGLLRSRYAEQLGASMLSSVLKILLLDHFIEFKSYIHKVSSTLQCNIPPQKNVFILIQSLACTVCVHYSKA